MPFFDYVCQSCGEKFEALVRTDLEKADEKDPCPGCGSDKIEQQVSLFSIRGTKNHYQGKVIDMSSGSCPCARHNHKHH
ncbi:MAG: zinc ribbon domain-containing protein [Rhodospirillales bacterium]|jgi:putative FmdB family regulatory protein|nr:zinc ribbon domain-containing protein [Rhodospirillales bacterium]